MVRDTVTQPRRKVQSITASSLFIHFVYKDNIFLEIKACETKFLKIIIYYHDSINKVVQEMFIPFYQKFQDTQPVVIHAAEY